MKQRVRWQPGNEESGQHIRDITDVEGVTLECNIGGEDGRLPITTGRKRESRQQVPKGPPKLKLERKDDYSGATMK